MFIGWNSLPVPDKKKYNQEHKISVIIPVRNEAKNIKKLLADLGKQSISKDSFEVVVVNDHSSDETMEIVIEDINRLPIKIKTILNNGEGKKNAIETGIDMASGELIVTTDGDCRVGQNWLSAISSYIYEKQAVMITGPVRFLKSGQIWYKALMMELSALQGVGAVSLKAGAPTMCNGANLAYLKQAFFEVGGYEGNKHILSGDDEFLMHKLSLSHPGRIHFLKDREAIVDTNSNHGWEWINQRRRWASKWEGYRIWPPKTVALLVLIFNLNIVFGLFLTLAYGLSAYIFLGIMVTKTLTDFTFISSVGRSLGRKSNLLIFIILEMIYPIYVMCFGFLGLFGNYTWKGRTSKIEA